MRVPKGLPQAVFELPGRVVPGLVVLVAADIASGGALWPALLARVSAGLLDPENVWAFALGLAVIVGMGLHAPLAALGAGVEAAIDRACHRSGHDADYEWLCVNAPEAADFAEEARNRFKVANALAAAFAVAAGLFAVVADVRTAAGCFVLAAGLAWRGAVAKTRFRETARRLRAAVGSAARDGVAPQASRDSTSSTAGP